MEQIPKIQGNIPQESGTSEKDPAVVQEIDQVYYSSAFYSKAKIARRKCSPAALRLASKARDARTYGEYLRHELENPRATLK